MTPGQKGALAEAEITAAATRMRLLVLHPFGDGARYDLGIDIGSRVLRVQCKWASMQGDVLNARCVTNRHTPRGYVATTYSPDEIDAIAAYAPDMDRCYLIPAEEVDGRTALSLRIAPTRNNQARLVRWAKDYEFERMLERHWGAIPTLHEIGGRHVRDAVP